MGREETPLPPQLPNNGYLGVAYSPDGQSLVTGGIDQVIRIWNPDTGQLRPVSAVMGSFLFALALSPDGKTVAGGCYDKTIRLFDAATGKEQQRLRGHAEWSSAPTANA